MASSARLVQSLHEGLASFHQVDDLIWRQIVNAVVPIGEKEDCRRDACLLQIAAVSLRARNTVWVRSDPTRYTAIARHLEDLARYSRRTCSASASASVIGSGCGAGNLSTHSPFSQTRYLDGRVGRIAKPLSIVTSKPSSIADRAVSYCFWLILIPPSTAGFPLPSRQSGRPRRTLR